jgi:hypothetical protein
MTSAGHLCQGFGSRATPVGGPLNLPALSLPNVPRTELRRFLCISNRNKVRIEIVPTHRKQRRATNSNRNFFRGSAQCAARGIIFRRAAR